MDGGAWWASPWGRKELDTTEQLHSLHSLTQVDLGCRKLLEKDNPPPHPISPWPRQSLAKEATPLSLSSVQSLSHVQLFVTPWNAALQASLSITNSWSLFKPMSVESVMPSNHLILCRSLLLPPSVFPSIRGFSK